jgi:hypothetical protein
MPLVALNKLDELGKNDEFYEDLHKIVAENGFIWSLDAEKYLLANARSI